MPDLYELLFSLLALAFVVLRVGPAASRSVWKISDVPPPPAAPINRDIVRSKAPQPIYPYWALRRGQVGWVLVETQINDQGEYQGHTVLAEAPEGMFSKTVARALKNATYRSHSGFPLPPRIKTLYKFVVPARDGSVPAWAVTVPGLVIQRSRGLLD